MNKNLQQKQTKKAQKQTNQNKIKQKNQEITHCFYLQPHLVSFKN